MQTQSARAAAPAADDRSSEPRAVTPAGPRVEIIGIGVQKAATSWIHACLADHPEIRPAAVAVGNSRKELNFFNRYYERGYGWYHRSFRFGAWKNVEFSTLYFHDANVPARIHAYNRDAGLVLSLRNPIDRAYSHHKHEVRRRRVPPDRIEFRRALPYNPSYVELGRYATHLSRWLQYFGPERIHVVFFEDVVSRPVQVLRDLFAFAGVDPSHTPPYIGHRINAPIARRSLRLHRLLGRTSRGLRAAFGRRAVGALKRTGIPRWIRDANRVEVDERWVPPLTAEDRRCLGRLFADENARLAELTGRDLSHWT